MKIVLLLVINLFFSVLSFSQAVFLKSKPNNEIASVSLTESRPSIIFFEVNNETTDYKKHKLKSKEVNAYFGGAYTSIPIINIGKGNIAEFNNKNGYFAFYRPNSKLAFGMIISNGIEKPILISNPNQYLKTIITYLNIGNADYLVPKTFNAKNEQNGLIEMQQLLKIKSILNDTAYANKLINHANTIHYNIADKTYKIRCKQRVYEMYSDSLMTIKADYGAKYLYNDKNELLEFINTNKGKETSYTKYLRDKNGLIQYMITGRENAIDTTLFIYEKDKYHTVNLKKGKAISFETFFLNDQMQCVRRYSKIADRLIWDISYLYDKFGRLVREGQIDSEMIYSYKNDKDWIYSGFSSYSTNPKKLILKNELINTGNEQIFIGSNENGKLNFKSISITDKNGLIKTYNYDKNNQLTTVGLLRCSE